MKGESIIEGRNPVIEALKSGREIEKILVAKGSQQGSIEKIIGMAKDRKIIIQNVDRKKLDSMSSTNSHQGVIAIVSAYRYKTIDDIFENAKAHNEDPFIVVLDEITDPHNLGSIIRTAECAGAHGVIIPKRRSVGITPVVVKASVGALEYIPVAKVSNISYAIDELKDKGVWIYGADINGKENYFEKEFSGSVALVIGSEGKGMSRLVKEKCDFLISIPMKGSINSLNASVAASLMMYEVVRQREYIK